MIIVYIPTALNILRPTNEHLVTSVHVGQGLCFQYRMLIEHLISLSCEK